MNESLKVLAMCAAVLSGGTAGCTDTMKTNPATQTTTATAHTELATLGGGCFWRIEAIFERLDGVRSVTSGYAGGHKDNPTYKEVCTGETGHAEVTQIEFDPQIISFEQLLEVFWDAHDPTTRNRQGADVGTQYRSVILYHDATQKNTAEKSKQAAAQRFRQPVATEIVPLTKFFRAEEYHQDYYRNNPRQPYCQAVIRPKLQKLQGSPAMRSGRHAPRKAQTSL